MKHPTSRPLPSNPKAWSTRNFRCLSAILRLQVALSEAFNALVGTYGNPGGSSAGAAGLKEKAFLPRAGVEAWLIKINRSLGRGSEYRAAEAIMEPGPEGGLTLEGTGATLSALSHESLWYQLEMKKVF